MSSVDIDIRVPIPTEYYWCNFVAVDPDGEIWAFEYEPQKYESGVWATSQGRKALLGKVDEHLADYSGFDYEEVR